MRVSVVVASIGAGAGFLGAPWVVRGQPEAPVMAAASTDIEMTFAAADGTPLEGRLTLPAERSGPVPVVFHLHGAGPGTVDVAFGYRDADGQVKVGKYMDYHAREVTGRGIAFFRMNKRGCRVSAEPPYTSVDRAVFSGATLNVLVDDYARGLEALRARPEIDPGRIVLMGLSEGSRTAPMLAGRAPDGVVGVVMMAYSGDDAKKTIEWQRTVGPWRNIQHILPAARDGELTRAEHEEFAVAQPAMARALPFDALDENKDGVVQEDDLARLNAPMLAAVLQAVEDRNDEFLWQNLVNLNSAYLLDWWDTPNSENLLKLTVPLAIFHGGLDGACRVEAVRETEAAFAAAGRSNLSVRIYPEADHNVGWTWENARDGGPEAFKDAFAVVEGMVKEE